ncbi:MAG TPA: ferredoxin [Acidimicrobiales bacterium]|nr:ferredoxin [Acidimicrobiales bacterium]
MKVSIDATRCRGHALCLGRAPEAFEFLDLEDRSVVRDGAEALVSEDDFLAAARECPERAIVVDLNGADGGTDP